MTLVDDVRQREPVRDDHVSALQGRPDDLVHELRPRRHEQQRLGGDGDAVLPAEEDELADLLADRGPARVGAGGHRHLLPRQPLDQ